MNNFLMFFWNGQAPAGRRGADRARRFPGAAVPVHRSGTPAPLVGDAAPRLGLAAARRRRRRRPAGRRRSQSQGTSTDDHRSPESLSFSIPLGQMFIFSLLILQKSEMELSKIATGIGKVFLHNLKEREKLRQWKVSHLDPRNASRTPSANKVRPFVFFSLKNNKKTCFTDFYQLFLLRKRFD